MKTVWCVFDNDGYECSSLVGVFSTEDAANAYKEQATIQAAAHFKELNMGEGWQDSRTFTVECVEVDKPIREDA